MKTDLSSSTICLSPGQLLELRNARGRAVSSVAGELWLTQHDDTRDVVIRAGETYRVECGGVTLVQSLTGAASVRIEDGVSARVIAESSRKLVDCAGIATLIDEATKALLGAVHHAGRRFATLVRRSGGAAIAKRQPPAYQSCRSSA